MIVYYRWWSGGKPIMAPREALNEDAALRLIRQRYPDAVLSDWNQIAGPLRAATDEQRYAWADVRAREEGEPPVADLLRLK